ncbi:S8 family serine peptidase [Nonomuraea sp. NPDC004702]
MGLDRIDQRALPLDNSSTYANTGTWMAAPHVAGAAALLLAANPGFTPQQVRDHLVDNATPNVVTNAGTGSPDRLLHIAQAPML